MSENKLIDKLNDLAVKFEEIGTLITDPSVIADMKRFVKLTKEYHDLEKIVKTRNRYQQLLNSIDEARMILDTENDADMRELAKEELDNSLEQLPRMEEEIKLLLIPEDPEDNKNAIVEIRGGTGGDEAAIFAGDLFRMYTKYCETKKLESGCIELYRRLCGRIQRDYLHRIGREGLRNIEIRIGGTPGTTCPRHRNARPRTHLGRLGSRVARSRRVRCGN